MSDEHGPVVKETGRYYVEALGRGLSILDCFVDGHAHLSLAEISARAGFQKGTTFRLLRTLEEAGYVRQDSVTKQYHLSFKVLDLQRAALEALDLPKHAQPLLEELNQVLHESVSIAVLEGTRIRYIARVPSRRIMSINLQVGSTLPAHATSMGKVLLAHEPPAAIADLYPGAALETFTPRTIGTVAALVAELEAVRTQGFALTDEELEFGLRSAAAPIYDHTGSVVAAINVSAASARIPMRQLRADFLPQLVSTAAMISRRLGYQAARSNTMSP